MTLPRVTALLPCYNAEVFLQRTLDCLAAQTWPAFDILIADDCSTDGTAAMIEAFARGRPNVRVLRREKNLGWLANCNDLMAEAEGDFLFFAFHDDVVEPTYVEKLARALMADPRAILAYSWMEIHHLSGRVQRLRFRIMHRLGFSRFLRMWLMVRQQPHWGVPNRGLFRREAFARIGGIRRNDEGEYAADWAWLLHMTALGRFVMVPEVLCRKYFQKTSLSVGWKNSARQMAAQRRAGFREIALAPGGRIEKALLGWLLARRVRAMERKAEKEDR